MSANHTPRPTPSRPTTPLRPPSRSSLRGSKSTSTIGFSTPLEGLEPGFAELADSMADLEANMMHLQLMHESLARFSESFAAFLYGMNMNAFCVDFPEAPIPESFRRIRTSAEQLADAHREIPDIEATVMTTDSFIEHPPASSKASSKFSTPAAPASRISRGGAGAAGGGAAGRAGRGAGRGRASGIARGSARGRGRG